MRTSNASTIIDELKIKQIILKMLRFRHAMNIQVGKKFYVMVSTRLKDDQM